MELSEIFRLTLVEVLKGKPRGTQSQIADELRVARNSMSDFVKGRRPFSESKREQIAKILGYNYEDFIAMGRQLLTGESSSKQSKDPETLPIDHAVRVLREAEEETGIKLNAKQRKRVTEMLREEIKKKEKESKDNIINMMKAFKE